MTMIPGIKWNTGTATSKTCYKPVSFDSTIHNLQCRHILVVLLLIFVLDNHHGVSCMDNSAGRSNVLHSVDYSDFINRLISYNSVRDDVIIQTVPLAENGFFFLGFRDRVQCYSCNVVIQNWNENEIDDPLSKHLKLSPDCTFALMRLQQRRQAESGSRIHRRSSYNNGHFNNGLLLQQLNRFSHHSSSSDFSSLNSENDQNNQIKPNNHDNNNDTSTVLNTDSALSTSIFEQHGSRLLRPRSFNNQDRSGIIQERSYAQSHQNRNNIEELHLTPENTNYTIYINRLRSFSTAPAIGGSALPSAAEQAAAGLFYTGPGDRAQCAWCRGAIYNWEAGDRAIDEHRRHFPHCPFIVNELYKDFKESNLTSSNNRNINNIGEDQEKIPGKIPNTNNEIVKMESKTSYDYKVNKKDGFGKEKRNFDENEECLEIPAVQIVLGMGYSLVIIKAAMKLLHSNPNNKVTAEKLLDVIFEMETQDTNISPIVKEGNDKCEVDNRQGKATFGVKSEYNTKAEILYDKHGDEMKHHDKQQINLETECYNMDEITLQQKEHDTNFDLLKKKELSKLLEENEKLKNTTRCKICLEKAVNILFLPCRHLVCCEECGNAVKQCPVCRADIVGTVSCASLSMDP